MMEWSRNSITWKGTRYTDVWNNMYEEWDKNSDIN